MNKRIVRGWLKESPTGSAEKFIFLTDGKGSAENIILGGFRSIFLTDADPAYFSLETLKDFLNGPEALSMSYTFVTVLTTRHGNSEATKALEGFDVIQGWQIFRAREYLSRPDHVDDLKRTLSDFVSRFDGPEAVQLKRLSEVQEKPAEWLIPSFLPRGQISLLCGDGGVGKTSLWCNIVAGLTSGRKTIFEDQIPFDTEREPLNVMFMSAEDSAETILKRRLIQAGANSDRVFLMDLSDPDFKKLKIGSPIMEKVIMQYRPALLVLDPIQNFFPASLDLSSRNQVRQSLETLVEIGAKIGTSFLLIVHSNKRGGVSGRKRIADSADLWDISRSVLIAGNTEDGFYCSHEKSNYGQMQDTILYQIKDGKVFFSGTTTKKDADFVHEMPRQRAAPAKEEARALIEDFLKDGKECPVASLDANVRAAGVSLATLKRIKTEMKNEGSLLFIPSGFGSDKRWLVRLSR